METALERYGFDSGDPLAIWINAAMHEIESMFDWPFAEEGPVTFQIAAGVNSVTVPNDFFKVIVLKDTDHQQKLMYYDRHKFTRDVSDETIQGYPQIYTIVSTNQIQVWQVPVVAVNFLMLYQAVTPDLVSGTDVPTTGSNVWPSVLSYPIVMRAASIGLMAENEEDRAKTAQDEYLRTLMAAMGKFGERELDEPTTVEDVQGYGGISGILGGV